MSRDKRETYNLRPHLRYWQRRLNLTDWKFIIEWRDEAGMRQFFEEDSPERDAALMAKNSVAATDADGPEGILTGAIEQREVRMVFKKGAFDTERDAVSTLVHEMIHNLFWAIACRRDDHLRRVCEEQVVVTLEEALLELAYPTKKQRRRRGRG